MNTLAPLAALDVFEEFAGWHGRKARPVHFFWHSFDLAGWDLVDTATRWCPLPSDRLARLGR